ncbi:MAG TPA: DUF4184 family protein [Bacteroidia bacterium]|jgi:hypothetical protein|nr:DUF4184 family protein [Bacteroidia bacterium]
MPFTFSHPAIVLPGKYLPAGLVSMTGLIIGSTTPDFEYFLRMRSLSLYSHTWTGMLWFDLPLAFVLTFVYHGLVRDALLSNLPLFLRKRLLKFKGFDWNGYVRKHFVIVLVSLLIGIASHILWDGFTHRQGQFVKAIPWLKENAMLIGVGYSRFYVLQNISTFVGGIVVLIAILRLPAESVAPQKGIIEYWLIAACITSVVVAIRLFTSFEYRDIDDLAVPLISAGLCAVIITPLIVSPKT